MLSPDELPVSIDEAARLLAVSARTLRRLIDAGELIAVRVGPTTALPVETLAGLGVTSSGEPLLRLHDVARRLGMSPREVRAASATGELRAYRVGHSLRWSCADIDAAASARK